MANDDKDLDLDDTKGDDADGGKDSEDKNDKTPGDDQKQKRTLTPEQRRGMLQRQLTKLDKELGILSDDGTTPAAKVENKKTGFDLTEKGYLLSNQITAKEFDFVAELKKETGKPIDELVESSYFQHRLKEFREEQAVKAAVPPGTKRSSNPARDEVDYWIAKGSLPPDPELRKKVVNERIKREENKSKFSDRAIV